MDRLLLPLLGMLVLLFAGAGAVWAYDRAPPIGFHVKLLLWRPGFDLPPSLRVQLDRALTARVAADGANQGCQLALGKQNAETVALGQASSRKIAAAEQGLRRAAKDVAGYQRTVAMLQTYGPVGQDQCTRLLDADRAVVEALR